MLLAGLLLLLVRKGASAIVLAFTARRGRVLLTHHPTPTIDHVSTAPTISGSLSETTLDGRCSTLVGYCFLHTIIKNRSWCGVQYLEWFQAFIQLLYIPKEDDIRL